MSDRNLKLRVTFEALDKLSGNVRNIAKGTKAMGQELGAARAEMRKLQEVERKLAGFRKLKRGLSDSEKKLEDNQRAVAELAREMKKAERPTASLTKKFTAAKNAAAKSKRELSQKRDKLEQMRRSLDKAGFSTSKMVDSERKLRGALDKTSRRIDHQKDSLARLHGLRARGTKTRGAGIGMTAGVTAPAGFLAKASFDRAADAIELQDAFDNTFKNSSAAMNEWAERTGDSMGRSTQSMQRGANAFGLFFNQVDPKNSAMMSKEFAVLAEDLESMHNLRRGEGVAKLRAGLSGEAEPLKALGIMLNETQVKAKAAEMGLQAVGGRLTEEQKILARRALILEKTQNAQGNVMETKDSPANKLRTAQDAMEEFQVAIGKELIPAITPLIDNLAAMLNWFTNLSPGVKTTIVVIVGLIAVLGPLLIIIGGAVAAIGTIAAGFALLTAPIWGVIAAVVAVIAAIAVVAYAVYANWDIIKAEFWSGVAAVGDAWDWLVNKLMEGLAFFLNLHATFLNIGRDIVLGIAEGISNAASAVWDALKNVVTGGINKVKDFLGIKSPSRVFMALGGYTSEGMAMGIDRGRKRAMGAAGRLAAGVTAAGSLALAPVASAQPGQGSAAARANQPAAMQVTIKITQQPGQSSEELAEEIKRKLEAMAQSDDRRNYGDDE